MTCQKWRVIPLFAASSTFSYFLSFLLLLRLHSSATVVLPPGMPQETVEAGRQPEDGGALTPRTPSGWEAKGKHALWRLPTLRLPAWFSCFSSTGSGGGRVESSAAEEPFTHALQPAVLHASSQSHRCTARIWWKRVTYWRVSAETADTSTVF